MALKFDSGPEFESVSKQIGQNADRLRKMGKLQYWRGSFPLNNSEISCEMHPRYMEENTLKFNVDAYQHTERFIAPRPPSLIPVSSATDEDIKSLLSGVDAKQLVFSAIENRRSVIHQSNLELQAGRSRIAMEKSSSDKLGSFKNLAQELVDACLTMYPRGSSPTEDDVNVHGLTLDRYKHALENKSAVVIEIAKELLQGEEQDIGGYMMRNGDELKWLDEMEGKAIQGHYSINLYIPNNRSAAMSLLIVDVGFQV